MKDGCEELDRHLAGPRLQWRRSGAQYLVLGCGPGDRGRPHRHRGACRIPSLSFGLPHRHPWQSATVHREHGDAGNRGAHRPQSRAQHAENVGGGLYRQHPRCHVVLGRDHLRGHILEPSALRILFEEVSHKAKYAFGSVLLKAVFGGWLVALIAWLVAASQDTISQVFFVYSLTFLIPAVGLTQHRGLLGVPHKRLLRQGELGCVPR